MIWVYKILRNKKSGEAFDDREMGREMVRQQVTTLMSAIIAQFICLKYVKPKFGVQVIEVKLLLPS